MFFIKIALILFLTFNIFTYIKRIISPNITQKEEYLIKVETLSLKLISIIEIISSSAVVIYLALNKLNFGSLFKLVLFIGCIKIALACLVAFVVYKISYKPVEK